jgi:hypothetical protein
MTLSILAIKPHRPAVGQVSFGLQQQSIEMGAPRYTARSHVTREHGTPEVATNGATWSRRSLLAWTPSLVVLVPWMVSTPAAGASVGFNVGSIYGSLPYSSPTPILVPRRTLGKDFCVSLLRSGYETCDELNFYPMDTWQRDFWLTRRAQWEPYTLQLEPLKITQGELSSPYYFDFIAAMQMEAISNAMNHPKETFREFCGEECEEEFRYVIRDPLYKDDSQLPQYFGALLGKRIYEKLRAIEDPIPIDDVPSTSSDAGLIAQTVADYFNRCGYDLKNEIQESQGGGLVVKSYGTATLWALKYLTARRAKVLPLYDAAVIQYLLKKKLGRESTVTLTDLGDTSLTMQIDIL